ncbi:MAG: WD40 repeat domain-containing protein [Candidatus Hydrogenedentes bacterium]|nr:WD40 repeat domain-containing protein [Candidatus Hydrogenedentota bacterium]
MAAFVLALLGLGVYSYVNVSNARNIAVREHARAEDENYANQVHLVQSYMGQNNYKLARETLWATNPGLRNWEWGYLLNRCYLEKFTLDDCVGAAYSPDGTRIATISRNKPIEIWDAETGKKTFEITEEAARIRAHRYFNNGTKIVGAGQDNIIRIWDTQTGKLLVRMVGHRELVSSFDVGPDSTRLVSTSNDGSIRVWDCTTGAQIGAIEDVSEGASVAYFSADGKFLVSCGADPNFEGETEAYRRVVTIWNSSDNSKVLSIQGTDPALSYDGQTLAVADGTDIVLVDVPAGTTRKYRLHTGFIRSVQFSQNGSHLLTSSDDSFAKITEIDTGKTVLTLDHGQSVAAARYSSTNEFILTMSRDGALKVWNTASGNLTNTLQGHADYLLTADFSPDGNRIVSAAFDQSVKVWESKASPGQRVLASYEWPIKKLSTSPDGQLAAIVLANRTMEIRRVKDGAIVAEFASYAFNGGIDASFSPDGKRVVAVLDEFTPMVWDIETQQIVSKFTGHDGGVRCVSFSPDGAHVLSGSWDNTARLWDAQTGLQIRSFTGHTDTIQDVAFNTAGNLIATASEDGTVKLWEAATGRELRTFKCKGGAVFCVAFSNDGALLATSGDQQPVRLWDVQNGDEFRTINGPENVRAISFSKDSSRLFLASQVGVRVVSASTGSELAFANSSDYLIDGSFVGDSSSFLAASVSGTVYEFTPLSWKSMPPTGSRKMLDSEMLALMRRDQVANPIEPPSTFPAVVVASTPEIISKALLMLTDAVHGEQNATLPVTGEVYNALARLCFQRHDELVALNGAPINSSEFATMASDLARKPDGPHGVEFKFNRHGVARTLQCRLVAPVTETIARNLDRQLTQEFFSTNQRDMAQWQPEAFIRHQQYSSEIGAQTANPDSLNGVWIGENDNEHFKEQLAAFGLATGDWVTAQNAIPIIDHSIFERIGESLVETTGSDANKQLVLDVNRGEFQPRKITLRMNPA